MWSSLRERSRSMTSSWIEWRTYIQHLHINETKVLSREIMKHDVFMSEETDRIFTKRKFSCWEVTKHDVFVSEATERIFTQRLNCKSLSKSVSQSWWRVENSINKSIVDFLSRVFDIHSRVFTIHVFLLSVETSLVEKRDRSHTHIKSFISNKQINIQNIKQKKFEFRFASSISVSLLQWLQWVRYND